MAESKAQKVARRAAERKAVALCHCGGDIQWVMRFAPKGRMVKACEKCGEVLP